MAKQKARVNEYVSLAQLIAPIRQELKIGVSEDDLNDMVVGGSKLYYVGTGLRWQYGEKGGVEIQNEDRHILMERLLEIFKRYEYVRDSARDLHCDARELIETTTALLTEPGGQSIAKLRFLGLRGEKFRLLIHKEDIEVLKRKVRNTLR